MRKFDVNKYTIQLNQDFLDKEINNYYSNISNYGNVDIFANIPKYKKTSEIFSGKTNLPKQCLVKTNNL